MTYDEIETTVRSTDVHQAGRAIRTIRPSGEVALLGTVLRDVYENDNIKAYYFQPADNNSWVNKSKDNKAPLQRLGVGSYGSAIVDPATVQQEILNRGWVIGSQYIGAGGVYTDTNFYYPDLAEDDRISFDHSLWSDRQGVDQKLYPGLRLKTSLQFGKMSAKIDLGAFRLVCTNGLIARVFSINSFDLRHNAEDDALPEFLDDLVPSLEMGNVVMGEAAVRKTADLIKRFRDESQAEALKGNRMGTDFLKGMQATFPNLTASSNRMASWHVDEVADLLDQWVAGNRMTSEGLTSLELLNAFTSPVNHRMMASDTERGIFSAVKSIDAAVADVLKVAQLSAILN